MPEKETAGLREEIIGICEDHLARLSKEAGEHAEARLAGLATRTATETAELLTQIGSSARRIRGAADPGDVLYELADSIAKFCDRSAVLLNHDTHLTGFYVAGDDVAEPGGVTGVDFALESAPLLARAVEQKETVVTTGGRSNVSGELAGKLGYEEDTPLRILPVVLRDTVVALALVDGEGARGPAIEALILTAEAWLEALNSRPTE